MNSLATYINRADSKKTTTEPPRILKMPRGKDIEITETEAKSDQYGLINNSISGNTMNTTFDFIQHHFTSTLAVLGLFALIIGLCCLWCLCKAKNVRKIARFVCIRRCRVTEELLDTEDRARAPRMTASSNVDLMEMEAVINMANKTLIENAYLRNSGAAPAREESNPSAC